MMGCLVLMLASCNGKKLESLNEKIKTANAQTEFTQEEYKTMIDYVSENYSEAIKLPEEEAIQKYPYMPNFYGMAMLGYMTGKLDQANSDRIIEINENIQKELEAAYSADIAPTEEFVTEEIPTEDTVFSE